MAPTRTVGPYSVWIAIKINEDGHLSLHSARNVNRPRLGVKRAGRSVNDETLACLRDALAGKTFNDPRYVDTHPCMDWEKVCDLAPKRFPETVFELDVWIKDNDALGWP